MESERQSNGCIKYTCKCNKIFPKLFKTVNWKANYPGNDDEVGRGVRRERITFPKLSQSLGIYLQVHHFTIFYILLEIRCFPQNKT